MNKTIYRYTFSLMGMSVALGILTYGFSMLFGNVTVTPAYPYMLTFLFAASWLAFYVTARSMQKKISRFANVYMIVNFLKLVGFSLFLLGYAYLHKKDAAPFIITFFIYYIFFTVMEVSGLKTLNRNAKKK